MIADSSAITYSIRLLKSELYTWSGGTVADARVHVYATVQPSALRSDPAVACDGLSSAVEAGVPRSYTAEGRTVLQSLACCCPVAVPLPLCSLGPAP